MVKRNYRGRYGEGENWRMQADRQQPERNSSMGMFFKTIFSTAANKFWVGFIGFILTAITTYTGIDLDLIGIDAEAIIAFVTSLGIYAIPNSKNPVV